MIPIWLQPYIYSTLLGLLIWAVKQLHRMLKTQLKDLQTETTKNRMMIYNFASSNFMLLSRLHPNDSEEILKTMNEFWVRNPKNGEAKAVGV